MARPLLVQVVFGALVAATIGAFFLTQWLKGSAPVVERVRLEARFTPNGDGRDDRAALRFDLPEARAVTVSMIDEDYEEVRRLVDDEDLAAGRHHFQWDGRTDEGIVAEQGSYRVRVVLPSEARAVVSPHSVFLALEPAR